MSNVHFSSDRMDWRTPLALFQLLDDEFDFDMDVSAREDNRMPCMLYCCPPDYDPPYGSLPWAWDGLAADWRRFVCWMNPPYGRQIGKWTAKAKRAAGVGATVVGLVPARTDTRWWHETVMAGASEVRLIRGRLRFEGAEASAPFPSAIVIWRPLLSPGPVRVVGWNPGIER